MNYEGTLIRPPSEADSLIFQITLGCSDNNCTFCPAYKNKMFKIKNLKQIEEEIKDASFLFPDTRRIFFADGDAIVIPQKQLLKIFKLILKHFNKITKIGIYASAKSLEQKSIQDLIELKAHKLSILYLGIETGDPQVYKNTKKYGSVDLVANECIKVKKAGIKLNTTIILGLGGENNSNDHALNTARILNKIKPDQIAALTLMVVKGTDLYDEVEKGHFKIPSKINLMKELKTIISKLDDFPCLFFSNHASNYFPINARMPKDKHTIIGQLNNIIDHEDKSALRPEAFRGL